MQYLNKDLLVCSKGSTSLEFYVKTQRLISEMPEHCQKNNYFARYRAFGHAHRRSKSSISQIIFEEDTSDKVLSALWRHVEMPNKRPTLRQVIHRKTSSNNNQL